LVVDSLERDECQPQLLDGREAADPQQVLLQDPDEALGSAVPFRLADEGRRACDAEEADLGLEVVADTLAAVVVAGEPKARSDALGKAAMALADGLLDRLEGLEAIGAAAGPPRPPGRVPSGDRIEGLLAIDECRRTRPSSDRW
jgi:hypothetical protein